MGAREDILAALRRAAPDVVELPDLGGLGVSFADVVGQFMTAVGEVGGECVRAANLEAIAESNDTCVLRGELGVAENGAVWVDGAVLGENRSAFVICEHLVLIVDANEIVADMHAAYARLAARPAGYGTFIAGPSKTADIEQALVIGAHGARSCKVVVVGDAPPSEERSG